MSWHRKDPNTKVQYISTETSIREIRFKSGFVIKVEMIAMKGRKEIGIITELLDPNKVIPFLGVRWFSGGKDWLSPAQLFDMSIKIDGKAIDPSGC